MRRALHWDLILLMVFCGGATATADVAADSLELDEAIVTGVRGATDVRHLSMTVTTIGRQQLTAQHQSSLLPTLMQQVPGLLVTSRGMMGYGVSTGGSGGLNLRGLTGGAGQMLVLIDGHPQYNGIYGHPISDSYQTLMAERVEVLRGPASLLYGSNAMGGVVNIVTRKPTASRSVRTDAEVGAGSYGTVQAEVGNQLRLGRFSSTIAAQYGRSDNHRPHMGFEQYGGYAKLGYDISTHWLVSGDLDMTHFNASNPGTIQQPKLENDQWITRGAASLAVENHYQRLSGAVSLYSSFGRHRINDGYNAQGGKPQTDLFRSRDAVIGVSAYESAQFFRGNRVTFGIDYQHIYGHAYYTNRQTGETVTTPQRLKQSAHEHENEVAGYVDFRQDISQWLTLNAGVRYDHHSTAGGEWIPQFGAVARFAHQGELRASASRGFRNPTMREMYMYGTANHDSLRAERLWNYELSWHQLVGSVRYGANVFYIEGDNMIQTLAGRNVNTGEIRNCGFELEASWRINSHWQLATNHSYLHMAHPVVAAPTYKGYLGADLRYGRWTANAALQYLHGLYTAVEPSDEKENFCLLSATVSYNVCKGIHLWARGENLLAQRYAFIQGYPMPRATFMAGVRVSF